MGNIGTPELMLIAAISLLPVLALYWIIRLAVRHGMYDAQRRNR